MKEVGVLFYLFIYLFLTVNKIGQIAGGQEMTEREGQ